MNLQHTHDLFWHLIALQWFTSSLFCVSVLRFVSFNLFSPWHALPISLPPVPPVPRRLRSHLLHLLLLQPAHFFPSAGDVERSLRGVRDPVSWAPSLLSDGPQSQSLTLSGAEVYTHGKLIPMPCLPHIAVVSKEVRFRSCRGDIFERQARCGKPLCWETTHTVDAMEERLA